MKLFILLFVLITTFSSPVPSQISSLSNNFPAQSAKHIDKSYNIKFKQQFSQNSETAINQKQALNLCYEYAGYSDDIEDGYENTGYEYVYNYIGITEYKGQEYYTFVMSWLVPSGDRYHPSYIQHEFVSVAGDAVFCGVLENNSEIYFGNDYTDTQQSNFSIFFYEWQFQKSSLNILEHMKDANLVYNNGRYAVL